MTSMVMRMMQPETERYTLIVQVTTCVPALTGQPAPFGLTCTLRAMRAGGRARSRGRGPRRGNVQVPPPQA